MNEITKKPNRPIIKFVRLFLPRFIDTKNEFITNAEIIHDLEPPYLILANHVNNWDPIYISRFVKHPIQFVTSDNFFRARWLRYILTDWVGAIPKTKSMSDSQAVKNILRVKKWDGVIGIFPEGARSWDGDSLPSIYSTAKLVKLLKIPVVFVNFKGCHLAGPRWAVKQRKGKIYMDFNIILSAEQIKGMDADQIHRVIEESLQYSEYAWQRENMFEYNGKNLAERIELMLFLCPHCNKIETLVSKGNDFYCTECGYKTIYTKTGFFETDFKNLYFDNPLDWNKWQIKRLHEDLDKIDQPDSVIFDDDDVILFKGKRTGMPKKIALGRMVLKQDKMIFTNERRQVTEFSLKLMHGVNIQSNRIFEFYMDDDLYRFRFKDNQFSGYKWCLAVEYLKEKEEVVKNVEKNDR